MGLNVNLVHLDGATLQDLAAVRLHPSGEVIVGADAISMRTTAPAATVTPRGLLLVDPTMMLAAEDAALAEAVGARVVAVMMSSTADTYSVAVTTPDGARRHLVDSQGERAVDEGAPLPEESGAGALNEDSTLALLRRLTGVDLDDALLRAEFQVLGEQPAGPPPARTTPSPSSAAPKGFFARLFGR